MSEFDGRRLPPDLERGRSRIQAWREQGRPGGRVSEPLWAMAVRLAATHGLSRTATVLGVSYCGLKQRAELAGTAPQPSGSSFIEVRSPVVVGRQCLLELDNGAGATMRVQLLGYDAADVQALASSLWNAE